MADPSAPCFPEDVCHRYQPGEIGEAFPGDGFPDGKPDEIHEALYRARAGSVVEAEHDEGGEKENDPEPPAYV